MRVTPLHVVGISVGVLLAYSAVKDRNPLQTVKNVLTGEPVPEPGSWSEGQDVGGMFLPTDVGKGIGAGITAGLDTSGSGKWPTSSHNLGPRFGEKGSHWASGHHTGLDIDGECGDAVWSATPGTVRSAGYAGAYGNRVVVKAFNLNNTEFWYCHLSRISVRPGKTVNTGDGLGAMGQTGNAYGCHLHLEVRRNGTPVDPLPYIQGGSPVPGLR